LVVKELSIQAKHVVKALLREMKTPCPTALDLLAEPLMWIVMHVIVLLTKKKNVQQMQSKSKDRMHVIPKKQNVQASAVKANDACNSGAPWRFCCEWRLSLLKKAPHLGRVPRSGAFY